MQLNFNYSGRPIIGMLNLAQKKMGSHGRSDGGGLPAGLSLMGQELAEAGLEVVETDVRHAAEFAILLWSITSPVEIVRMYNSGYAPPSGQRVITGGMCALNPHPVRSLADVMVFGRAEGQMCAILDGARASNIWRKGDDPDAQGSYEIRQADALLPGELQIGCPNKCLYCQYTWVRKCLMPGGYNPGMARPEDDWNRVEFSAPGRYVTALDGFSEQTRLRVNKHVRDADIIGKIRDAQSRDFPSAIVAKVFMVVGFPWESPASLVRDIARFRQLLAECDAHRGGRVVMMFMITPFSPEPMTPMEAEPVPAVEWRGVVEQAGRALYWSEHLEAFILPQIHLNRTLMHRVAINRTPRGGEGRTRDFIAGAAEAPDWCADFSGRPIDLRTYCSVPNIRAETEKKRRGT